MISSLSRVNRRIRLSLFSGLNHLVQLEFDIKISSCYFSHSSTFCQLLIHLLN